jgi:peptidoglycan/LPS O-acetylase OafA/YrhL
MTLSGYLFAKLLDGKRVSYSAFFWNRALRLFPLLIIVMIVCGVQRSLIREPVHLPDYSEMIAWGVIKPTWPNGGWSITAELHFYLLLPIILLLGRKSRFCLPAIILAAIALRTGIYLERGEVQWLAYFTLVGRIDQFLLGILAFQYRKLVAGRHALVWFSLLAFMLFYWYFNKLGGFMKMPTYPSTSPLWIALPTIEGLAYALLISYYDNTFSPRNVGFSKFVGRIGTYSYSIYLLHFFVVFKITEPVGKYVMDLGNFYVALLWAAFCFLLMVPVGYLSFRFIESPFLKFRRRYVVADGSQPLAVGTV